MKTKVPALSIPYYYFPVIVYLCLSIPAKSQTYNSIANGAWSSVSTWQGGSIPNATNIPASAVINIKHCVTYSGGPILNNGTINIQNTGGISPRLFLASGVTLTNQLGATININNGELRQYRFAGGGESGTLQTGAFINAGGYVKLVNSFMEIAGNWENKNDGVRVTRNSSIVLAGGYKQNSNATDTIEYSSVSCGWDGSGVFSITGSKIFFQSFRAEIASPTGTFLLSGCIANGDIDYITLKNHVTGILGSGTITVNVSVVTTGLNLDAYAAVSAANYFPNGKVSGTQILNNLINYFPATLFASSTQSILNYSQSPVLVSGTALQPGAVYKFESISPGLDAYVKIDSFVNGASLNKIDDNSGGLGYLEGFQPEIKSGPTTGTSYVVFKIDFHITGTLTAYPIHTFNITALDIDGNDHLNEFDQISAGAGAAATYMNGTPNILLTQVSPGTFKGINISNTERSGIDTAGFANMFTVSNTNVSTVTLKLGAEKTTTPQESRQFGIYFKGFVYPFITLPVKMESFTATLAGNNKKVDLKWTTAGEINVSHFVIERSFDGTNFTDAAVVFAFGNTAGKTNYSFPDQLTNNQAGVIYYRLRSVDNDGKGQYSEIRVITIRRQTENSITIHTYPNPVTNELRVTIPSSWQNKKVVYEMLNANGQATMKIETANSIQTETLRVSNLVPGCYIIRVACNGETARQKIIKK